MNRKCSKSLDYSLVWSKCKWSADAGDKLKGELGRYDNFCIVGLGLRGGGGGGDLTEAGVEKEKKKEKKWNLIGCVKHTMWKFEFYAWKQMATYVNDIGRFSNGNW